MTPLVIGLTGPIGCGKTHVLEKLVSLGAEGIDADEVAHDVIMPGGPAYDGVVAAFGNEIVSDGGRIDRAALGARVFRDPAALQRLEGIVHPAVRHVIVARVEASRAAVVVIEAIKLLEAGLADTLCDEVWVAMCSEGEQLARLKATRGMDPAAVRQRSANQMPATEMAARADRVIDTDGSMAETKERVRTEWRALGLPLPDGA